MRIIAFLFLAAILVGCAAPLGTPSGRPEIVVATRNFATVRSRLTAISLAQGYAIRSESDNELVSQKPWRGISAAIYQSEVGGITASQPDLVVTYTLVAEANGTHIYAVTSTLMRNLLSGEEKSGRLNLVEIARDVQKDLEQLKASLEKRR